MAGFGELVSTLDDLMGDYNAVKKGNVSQRVGRRATGKATGNPLGRNWDGCGLYRLGGAVMGSWASDAFG